MSPRSDDPPRSRRTAGWRRRSGARPQSMGGGRRGHGLEVEGVGDAMTQRRPESALAGLGLPGQDHQRQQETDGEDAGGPPEPDRVAMDGGGAGEARLAEVSSGVVGGGAGGDRAQQGQPDGAARPAGRC